MAQRPLQYIPTDPLFPLQWHLLNTGNIEGAVAGFDINVVGVWPDYTGRGVLLGMQDDGVDEQHPDLAPNYRQDLSWDVFQGLGTAQAGPTESHGMAVAGLAAAAHNGIGGVGVAFGSQLAAFRDSDNEVDVTITYARVLDRMRDAGVDISINSWGVMAQPFDSQSSQHAYMTLTERMVNAGRDGLGTIFVFSSGNDRLANMNANYDSVGTLPYAIVVAASDQSGNVTGYSTPGASVLVTAPGSAPRSMVTTDRLGELGYNKRPGEAGNYTDIPGEGFSGTSASAPVAAGVVALMLEANPGLGYRDVQEILAYSAQRFSLIGREDTLPALRGDAQLPADIRAGQPEAGAKFEYGFNTADDWNGGGLMMSHHYGYGHIDALAAVRLAESWSKVGTVGGLTEVDGQILQEQAEVAPQSRVELKARYDHSARIEQMHVKVELETEALIGLELELISPNGTVSRLADHPVPYTIKLEEVETAVTELDWLFTSVRHWGEDLSGEWTLRVSNDDDNAMLTVSEWSITALTAADSRVQLFTNEFQAFAEQDAGRLELKAAKGHINAAAVTQASALNLATGEAHIGGTVVSLDQPGEFRHLTTGDGNDVLIGNGHDNIFMPGRGDNLVDGGSGIDVLRLIGRFDEYHVARDGGVVRVTDTVRSGGGTDTAGNIDILLFSDQVVLADLPQRLGAGAFDSDWYLKQNADVAAAVAQGALESAGQHYSLWGAGEGRSPNALFNESWYLARNADVNEAVRAGGVASGYQHYQSWGWAEGRAPSAWMDTAAYLRDNPDVAAAQIDPLQHYLLHGLHEGRGITATAFEMWG